MEQYNHMPANPQINIDKVLPPKQKKVADFLKKEIFSKLPPQHFFLVGGTAISLQYGHRQSIDFDFFSFPSQKYSDPQVEVVDHLFRQYGIYYRQDFEPLYGQQHYLLEGIGITFMGFQNLQAEHQKELYNLPIFTTETVFGFDTLHIKDLAALKAFARCQRSKMKDIVDIAEILNHQVSFQEIISTAEQIFGYDFSYKEFLSACSNIDDILDNALDEQIKFINNRDTIFYINFLKKELKKLYG